MHGATIKIDNFKIYLKFKRKMKNKWNVRTYQSLYLLFAFVVCVLQSTLLLLPDVASGFEFLTSLSIR